MLMVSRHLLGNRPARFTGRRATHSWRRRKVVERKAIGRDKLPRPMTPVPAFALERWRRRIRTAPPTVPSPSGNPSIFAPLLRAVS